MLKTIHIHLSSRWVAVTLLTQECGPCYTLDSWIRGRGNCEARCFNLKHELTPVSYSTTMAGSTPYLLSTEIVPASSTPQQNWSYS